MLRSQRIHSSYGRFKTKRTRGINLQNMRRLRSVLGCPQEHLARLMGISVRTVSRWERSKCRPSNLALEKLHIWEKIIDKLEELEKDPTRWLHSPNESLGGKTPWEIANSPGGPEKILDLLGRLEWGIPT